MRISEAQRRALADLNAGRVLRVFKGGGRPWWKDDLGKNISTDFRIPPTVGTWFALLSRGLIEKSGKDDWRWGDYRITESGRLALQEAE
jgi:hypothetical protein